MKFIDLHVHSTCSDGTLTPSEVVALARQTGLAAFALTDHDSTEGLDEALRAATAQAQTAAPMCAVPVHSNEATFADRVRSDQPIPQTANCRRNSGTDADSSASGTGILEVIPGIEFSTDYEGTEIHIVGLDIDYQNPEFQRRLGELRAIRGRRNEKMIGRMAADGIAISMEAMEQRFGAQVWTRAHLARYLMEHGYVSSISEAFHSYIGEDCKYFVSREMASPLDVVPLIRQFHGIPILAHPMQYKLAEKTLCTLIQLLKERGLIGMEIYYSTHTPADVSYLSGLADRFGLLASGGSDFHGANKPDIHLGSGKENLRIPYELLAQLRNAVF